MRAAFVTRAPKHVSSSTAVSNRILFSAEMTRRGSKYIVPSLVFMLARIRYSVGSSIGSVYSLEPQRYSLLIINGITVLVENPKNIWYIKAFRFLGLVKCPGERSCEITGCDQTTPLSEASISRQEPLLHNIAELCTDFLGLTISPFMPGYGSLSAPSQMTI